MSFTIKSKITTGISIFFMLLLTVSAIAIYFINILSSKTENLLTANYNTIRYCSEMSNALNNINTNPNATDLFEKNLVAQEHNITEPGEAEATGRLRDDFEQLKAGRRTDTIFHQINTEIYNIYRLNQVALEHKNTSALETAGRARLWLTVLTTLIVLISFSLTLNFPGYIANPLRLLTEGIKEVAEKKYDKRIHLDSNDEFGEMAQAFNVMAQKLYEYEHSNLSKLMFEKKRVETIINQMEDAVIGFDVNNKILFINHMAEGLFNLKEEVVVNKYALDVAKQNDLLRTVLQKTEKQPLKIIVNKKEHYFFVDSRTVYSEGQNIGEVFTLRDITSFKELDISKTNLLATISHELKTPISSIKMSTKLVNDERIGNLNTEQKELLHNIDEDADRLLRLTSELLNMTQIETGNIQLKLQRVSPLEIVNTSVQAVQVQAEQKNIQLEVHCTETLPYVLADADKTSWVLINLMTNAIKYSEEGTKTTVNVTAQQNLVQFSVQDNGIGIEEKYLSKIFDRYFKVPSATQASSTGLGLAISKEFIEAQGGNISVKSPPGKGSIFVFSLPLYK
ncbi:MAG: ATP-binding protein [Flavipsychrobacter sp.]|nr:ATP-binding protein [Flavipsychrobacter sp.]